MMKRLSILLFPLLIIGCSTSAARDTHSIGNTPTSVKAKKAKGDNSIIIVKSKPKKITIKCDLPNQPRPLARPLPLDSPKMLIDRLTVKLSEWVSYGDKVEKSCK